MAQPEDPLATAERRVREGEERVALQRVLLRKLEHDDHPAAAARARGLLAALEWSLELARDHLRMERRTRRLP